YASVEATLRLYDRGVAVTEVPVIRAIAASRDLIAERAARFKDSIQEIKDIDLNVSLEEGASVIGGGSAPEVSLPTVLIALQSESVAAETIEQSLRSYSIPVITRTERDRVLIDLRTVATAEEQTILEAIASLAQP